MRTFKLSASSLKAGSDLRGFNVILRTKKFFEFTNQKFKLPFKTKTKINSLAVLEYSILG